MNFPPHGPHAPSCLPLLETARRTELDEIRGTMWYLLSWVALGIVLAYLVKKFLFPPKKIEPAGKTVLVTGEYQKRG